MFMSIPDKTKSMSFETVSIGSTSGKFKYILIEKGKTLFIRGDPNLEYHGTTNVVHQDHEISRSVV